MGEGSCSTSSSIPLGGLLHSFTFTVASGATLNFGSGSNVLYTVAAGSSISGAGGVSFNFDTLVNGTFSATGLVTVSRGSATFNVPATLGSLLVNGGTLNGSGNLIVSGATTWSDGNMSGAGTTTFNGPVAVTGNGNLGLNRSVVNNATATWNLGNNVFGTGTWSNQSGALLDIQNDKAWSASFSNLAGATVRKSAGAGTSTMQGAFNNSGAVEVNTGTLSFTGGGSSSGNATFTVASGATINFGSGANLPYTVAAGSSITGAGGVSFNFDTAINGAFSATGLVTVSRGSATFNVPATFGSLAVDGGTLNGPSNLIVSGATTWSDGSISGAGTMTLNGPVALTGNSNLGLNRSVVNNAATTWNLGSNVGGSGSWSNQSGALFDIQNSQTWSVSFSNLAGATFRKSAGAGTSTIQGAFNNSGTLQAQSGIIAFNGGFTQTSGTTTLSGGSISANSVMNFNGGSLTGSGSLAASVAFGNASIAPGSSPGTLTFGGNLALSTGSVLNFELGTLSDLIIVNGNLTLDGTLNVAPLAGFGQGTFVLLDYSGTLTDNGLDLGSLPGGFDYQIVNDAGNTQVLLQVAAVGVPEPATWMMLGSGSVMAGCGTYAWWSRRRRRQSRRVKARRSGGRGSRQRNEQAIPTSC